MRISRASPSRCLGVPSRNGSVTREQRLGTQGGGTHAGTPMASMTRAYQPSFCFDMDFDTVVFPFAYFLQQDDMSRKLAGRFLTGEKR